MDKGKAPLSGDEVNESTRALFCPFPLNECDYDLVSMYFDVDKYSPFLDDLGFTRGEIGVGNAYSSPLGTQNSVKVSDEESQSSQLPSDRQKVRLNPGLVQADSLSGRRQWALKSRKGMREMELVEEVERAQREAASLSSHTALKMACRRRYK